MPPMVAKYDTRPVGKTSAARHEVHLPNRSPIPVERDRAIVHELTATGAVLETGQELSVGSKIDVWLNDDLCISGVINRADAACYGCAFDHPLSLQDLERALWNPAHAGASAHALDDGFQEFSTMRDGDAWSRTARVGLIFGSAIALWGALAFLSF